MARDAFSETEDSYVTVKSKISICLSTDVPRAGRRTSEAGAVLRQIQLPKISLPSFDGDQLAWESFRNLFQSLVHDVDALAPVQKLQYLKASLSREAAAVVVNIEVSDNGYTLAWDELMTRYDNRRVLLASHMRVLLSSAPATKPSAAEINRLISIVNKTS
ncbi:hypothetical protein RF55_11781 [Lasius niger]|uniref:Uncharacterized protein n=1 Tax=Lasius niger TaxID=67767 RepID=A0A0J7KES5_LASNI|nr:hypothetical protein RF55_11781 [Lasius niger]